MDDENKKIEQTEENKTLKIAPEKGVLSVVSPLFGFIISHWGFFLVMGLCTSIYGEWKVLEHYRTDYFAEKAVNVQLTANLKAANAALDDQNTKAEQAAKDSADKKKEIDALVKKLADKDVADKKIIDALRNKPSPQTCQAVETDIDDFVRKISW